MSYTNTYAVQYFYNYTCRTKYTYTNKVHHTYEETYGLRLPLQGTPIPKRYGTPILTRYTYSNEVHLPLLGTLTPTVRHHQRGTHTR
jgi:hypothetical protein